MTARDPRNLRGFTLVEVAIAILIAAVTTGALVALLGSTEELVGETRAESRAAAEHRRSLSALARALRGVQLASLTGFTVANTSTAPGFRRVTGRIGDVAEVGPAEQLVWRAEADPSGPPDAGAVWLASPDGDLRLAPRVPNGGFRVRQDGRVLLIHLATFHPDTEGGFVRTAGSTAIAVRN